MSAPARPVHFAGPSAMGSMYSGVHVLSLPFITAVVLAPATPAATPADAAAPGAPAEAAAGEAAPGTPAPPPGDPGPGPAEISPPTPPRAPAGSSPPVLAPLNAQPDAPPVCASPPCPGGAPAPIAPFGAGPRLPSDRPDPRTLRAVRIDLLIGMTWRLRTTEPFILASVEAGRLQGFSGSFHAGVIVAPDRNTIAAVDFPIGAGFVARRRFGERPIYGSVGLSAGVLVHRASTDLGVVRRVDPDLQLPLRFAWTAGRVGLSVALIQGFSFRTRTYERRGIEVWTRLPYRIAFTLGLHFDVGVRPAKPAPPRRALP